MSRGILKGLGKRYRTVKGKKVKLVKRPSVSGLGYTWQLPKKNNIKVSCVYALENTW